MAGKAGELAWVERETAGVQRSGAVRRCDQTQGLVRQNGGVPQQGRWNRGNLGLRGITGREPIVHGKGQSHAMVWAKCEETELEQLIGEGHALGLDTQEQS